MKMKLMIALKNIVRLGISEDEISLSALKSVLMINRVTMISALNVLVYIVLTFSLGLHVHSILCALSLPLFFSIFRLLHQKRIETAKVLFIASILLLISLFSIGFGEGLGSEYWICVVGGISLLTFRSITKSMVLVLITFGVFLMIKVCQFYLPPIFFIDEGLKNVIFKTNMFFIFSNSFFISYVLRYSSEEFEKEIQKSNKVLNHKNKDLTDSINYARRIQQAVLPSSKTKENSRGNIFIHFEPKDIVSGDFYWLHQLDNKLLFAIVDGSGHGVTGALNSIMAYTMLTQCVEEQELTDVKEIISKMKDLVAERIMKWNDKMADQIELTLCSFNKETRELEYMSNGNSLMFYRRVYNVKDDENYLYDKGDQYAFKQVKRNREFINPSITEFEFDYGKQLVFKDDMLYLMTNGMADQFGGPRGKKFSSKRKRDLLMSVQHLSLEKQKYIINDVISNWRGKLERTDDITILGFRG